MSEKKRVLFVDDDSDVLSGMKRMLRSMRKELVLSFATGGQKALEEMAQSPFDIVISDMRMPGMDGAALLQEIRSRYPNTMRVMLTGQADDDSVLRTVGVAHQFLAKPCESETLKEVLSKVTVLHDLLSDDQLQSLVSSVNSLPTLPESYTRLQELINDPESAIADVAALIEEDVAMSAKILQLVNSAFFGLYKHIDSPGHAVNLLGLDTIKALVLGVQIFSEMDMKNKQFSVGGLFSHSMKVGKLAQKIALAAGCEKEICDDCLIAGILHDVGKLLLLSKAPEQYSEALDRCTPEKNLHQAEQEVIGADHGMVGAYLIGLWGLPGPVVEAIGFHHRTQDFPMETFTPVAAVHLADALYYTLFPQEARGPAPLPDEGAVRVTQMAGGVEDLKRITLEVLGD
jgi:putative nucleotidyltransferase with HDIG domain